MIITERNGQAPRKDTHREHETNVIDVVKSIS